MFKYKLKELREKEGIFQQALVDKLFVSRSAVAKWENGNGIPSDVNLEAICKFFDVEEESLLDRKDMKEVVEKLDKKNNKVLWFVLGIIIPLVLVSLSLLAFFEWESTSGVCISLYVASRGIFALLVNNYSYIILIALSIYIYQIIFSFIYWKIDIKKGRLIQIMNLCISTICFTITFIFAVKVGLNDNFVLIFLSDLIKIYN